MKTLKSYINGQTIIYSLANVSPMNLVELLKYGDERIELASIPNKYDITVLHCIAEGRQADICDSLYNLAKIFTLFSKDKKNRIAGIRDNCGNSVFILW